jgi:ribonucleotide monophosphatase NagD (HAD superfamily)
MSATVLQFLDGNVLRKWLIFVTNTSNKKRKVVATMQQKLAVLQQDKD